MITKNVAVTMVMAVTVDETKFTPEFFAEFCNDFYPYETLDKQMMHLAQMAARGLYDLSEHMPKEFIEGYGPAGEMGISVKLVEQDEEMLTA